MKKIIFLITVLTLIMISPESGIYSQTVVQTKSDTLLTGGVYRFILTDGRVITGEFTGYRNSGLRILTGDDILDIKRESIKSIEIPDLFTGKENKKNVNPVVSGNKFKMLSSVQTGFAIPAGDFSNVYSTSSGFQISAYELFSRATGIGFEFQYNHFHGPAVQYQVYQYYNIKTESGNYNSSTLKLNFIFGNLNPKSAIVFYGLFGLGLQLNSEGEFIKTDIYYNSQYEYKSDGYSGLSFIYGLGAGTFYKVSKKIGINLEFQYDKLTGQDYFGNNYQSSGGSGFYTIKAGIMYTNF